MDKFVALARSDFHFSAGAKKSLDGFPYRDW